MAIILLYDIKVEFKSFYKFMLETLEIFEKEKLIEDLFCILINTSPTKSV